ncbi:MAG: hypothetical protein QOG80_975 [Pseudonocardiales bacterium]|jgi:hypothetical protein|nr:hypothetical protein [Pseudonocardiales bacterium]
MDATTATHTAELDALRRRRAELRESMGTLERALAGAAAGRAVIWGERVHAALLEIADDWGEHVVVTEGPGGLHESILSGALRLANAVGSLAGEHELIATDIAEAVAASEPPVGEDDVAPIRDRAIGLLGRLAHHRQRGADLIYEAYATDIGGGD